MHTLQHSGLLPASELQTFSAPVWRDEFTPSTPNSKLHPSVTGAESLIRWTGTPLWINGPDSTGLPDGAYITGDIVNGKTRIPELASAIIGEPVFQWSHSACATRTRVLCVVADRY
jgi:hypothetical protein